MMAVIRHLRVTQMCHCFYRAELDDSSVEPEEMDFEDYGDNAKNERDPVGTIGEEIGRSHPPLCRST